MQAGHAFIHTFVLIPYMCIRLDGAREQAEVCHPANEWVSGGLPYISGEWFSIRWFQSLFTVLALCHAFSSIQWRWHQVDDIVEKRDCTNLTAAGCAKDRDKLPSVDNIFQTAHHFLV